jgi:hypothetical protein
MDGIQLAQKDYVQRWDLRTQNSMFGGISRQVERQLASETGLCSLQD